MGAIRKNFPTWRKPASPLEMTEPERPIAGPATHTAPDHTRWTGEKASAFLKALSLHGRVAKAAREVGMSRQSAYRLRARAPLFAQMWDRALDVAEARRKEASAAKRARRAKDAAHPLLARTLPDESYGNAGSAPAAAPRSRGSDARLVSPRPDGDARRQARRRPCPHGDAFAAKGDTLRTDRDRTAPFSPGPWSKRSMSPRMYREDAGMKAP